MSSDIAISVEGLGKCYRIQHKARRPASFAEAVRGAAAAPFKYLGDRLRTADESELFWALKDVSFEVRRGEVIGIIGRNGAGKSTLLKILSRITDPTTGHAEIRGRVNSLLEVGTGFHLELSGRENIYLNAAMHGMKRAEIKAKLDEIIAFAEVEKFIDTPVKRYSSGMYMRLAFAVAAHLEPEIMIIDEVLAVGDAAFQKKCLGKMRETADSGRTVVFVSHNMDAIRRLCSNSVWLDQGQIRVVGPTEQCISEYLLRGVQEGGRHVFDPPHQLANGMPAVFHSVSIATAAGKFANRFSARDPVHVSIDWENSKPLYKPRVGFVMQTSDGMDVLTAVDANSWAAEWLPPGRRISSCVIPGGVLNEAEYILDFSTDSPNRNDFTQGRTGAILRFNVEDDMTLPNKYYGQEGFRDDRWHGVLLMNIPWKQVDCGPEPQPAGQAAERLS